MKPLTTADTYTREGERKRKENGEIYMEIGRLGERGKHSFMQRPVHPSFGRVKTNMAGRNMVGRVVDV